MTEVEIVESAVALPALVPATETASNANAYLVYLARFGSDESKRVMAGCLDRMAALVAQADREPGESTGRDFPWHLLRHEHTAALRALMQQQTTRRRGQPSKPWSPSHVNLHLAALRGVLKQAWKLGQMSTDDYMRAVAIEQVKGRREPAGRSVSADEFSALLAVCEADTGPAGVRDAAIFALLHSTGLRRSEVVSVCRADYDTGEGRLRIIGKGNKERIAFLHESATPYVVKWLRLSDHVRGPIFCPIDRWQNILDRHMTAKAVADVVYRRRMEAGLARMTPHDFRRTFAGDLLDSGADLVQVKGLLGHESADVTTRYDRRPERQRQAAVNRLVLPPARPQPEEMRQ